MPPIRPDRLGADACPGTLAVHAAADGGLARIRTPGGLLTSAQLRMLAIAAVELGDGRLELTSRANVQLRGLAPGAEVALAGRARAAGLLPSWSHERARNIVASPLSGRDGAGLLDIRPLVQALDLALCGSERLAQLPGRFLFTLDDGRGDVAGLGGDVGLLAVGCTTFALLLAGVDSGVRLRAAEAVAAVVDAARAFLDVRAQQGATAWRLSELDGGVAKITARLGRKTTAERASVPAPARTPIGALPQRDGRTAVSAVAPLARLTASQAELVAAVGGEVRVTPWRGVVVPDLSADAGQRASARFAAHGLIVDPVSPWVTVTACTGRPGCAKSLADVRADVTAVATGLPVHWVGCGRRCGRPTGPHVEVLATGGEYEVRREGRVLARSADMQQIAAAIAVAGEGS